MPNIGIDSGSLRHRLAIYAPPDGQYASGQPIDTNPSMDGWTLLVTRWGMVVPNIGAPYIQSDQIRNSSTHRITIRYFSGLTPSHRIVYGSRIFNVTGLISSEERNIDTMVGAQEVIG
jgi:SPP1 family predicted phage head-tail adaptor